MIISFRPKHERLLREIYKKDGTVDEQKLSFFKHYLQQQPMKISESMNILKEYTKKYSNGGNIEKHLTTMEISSCLIQEYSMFCTSFEISALRLIKTHLKETLRIINKSKDADMAIEKSKEELKKCFDLFSYAGTRSSKAEKITTHIFLALASSIDAGFLSVRENPPKNNEIYENLNRMYSGKWNISSTNIKKEIEEERTNPEREREREQEEESYSTDSTGSSNFADNSCNYTDDRSSSSSLFLDSDTQDAQKPGAGKKSSDRGTEKDKGREEEEAKNRERKQAESSTAANGNEQKASVPTDGNIKQAKNGAQSEDGTGGSTGDGMRDVTRDGMGDDMKDINGDGTGEGTTGATGDSTRDSTIAQGEAQLETNSQNSIPHGATSTPNETPEIRTIGDAINENGNAVASTDLNIPGGIASTVTSSAIMNSLTGLSISHNTLPVSIRGEITKTFISSENFVVESSDMEKTSSTDFFKLSLLNTIIKTSGLLIHHTEKKLHSLNNALVKAAPFNAEIRQEIFTSYFQMLSPTSVPLAVKQVIEIASVRKIPNIHKVLYSMVNNDLYSDLIIQSNVILTQYKTKIFEGGEVEARREAFAFLLLQTVLFVNSVQVSIPPARMTKSFYFLLRAQFPKKSLFRKIVIGEADLQERSLTIKYFKLFISKCLDKEIVFLSLLRRAFQKEAGIGNSSVPSDLKLIIAKELQQSLSETGKCTSLALLDFLLDIACSPQLQFREHINKSLEKMVEKEVLGKRSQFEEPKRLSTFARIRTHAMEHGGLYVTLLKKALPTITKGEVRTVAGVFSTINDHSGLEECGKYIDISESVSYCLEEDQKLCNKEGSAHGSSVKSGTTFSGVRKSSIRLFDIFKRLK